MHIEGVFMSDIRLGRNERVEVLGVPIDVLTMDETVELVKKYINTNNSLHLMGVNADKINLAIENECIFDIIKGCGIVNADGASVVLASKYLNKNISERVAGIDLMQELLKVSDVEGYGLYFLGAKNEVLNKMIDRLSIEYNNLNILGKRDGYFTDKEIINITNELLFLKPKIVFVGITSPKKEYLIKQFQKSGINSVFMGVGGSFDVLSGEISRAPLWMQNSNLEWLYRVIKEPKRLFRRYFVGNITFIKKVVKNKYEK